MKKLSLSVLIALGVIAPKTANTQSLTVENIKQLRKSTYYVSDSTFGLPLWGFLDDELKDKQYVFIGEFTHGARQVFDMQKSLISYLIDNHGFDVVLFESGIGELYSLSEGVSERTPRELTGGFFGGWRNQSREELMAMLQEKQVAFAGFDCQKFGGQFQETLDMECQKAGLPQSLYQGIDLEFDGIRQRFRKADYEELRDPVEGLLIRYAKIREQLSKGSASPFIDQTLRNREGTLNYYLQFAKDKDWTRQFNSRDSLMAENVRWLIQNQYKGRKVIVVSHNFHISRYNEKQESMGEILNRTIGDETLVLSAYALEGHYAGNSGNSNEISPVDSAALDIKQLALKPGTYCQAVIVSDDPVFSMPVVVNDTFIDLWNSNTLIPSQHFDVLVFLDHVSAR